MVGIEILGIQATQDAEIVEAPGSLPLLVLAALCERNDDRRTRSRMSIVVL
jgi:hypothetical protein